MKRVNLSFTPDQHDRLHAEAKRSGLSMAELVRRFVDQSLAATERDIEIKSMLANPMLDPVEDGKYFVVVAEDDRLRIAYLSFVVGEGWEDFAFVGLGERVVHWKPIETKSNQP